MKRTFRFIINPIAGPKDNLEFWNSLKQILLDNDVSFKKKISKRPGHATKWTDKRVEKGTESIVVSMGGDGTFNEVASSLVNSGLQMAHIPRGSGNGLARMLKIPSKLKKIPDYLKNGVPIQIDCGKLNDLNFFCTAGFGFDALVAHHFSTSKTRGLKSYVLYTLKSYFNYKGVDAEIELDGVKKTGRFFTLTVANANQYGNNAFIAPEADLQDGLLDVTMIRPFPKWMAPVVALALFGKWIHKFSFVEVQRISKLEIKSLSSSYFHRDGEAEQHELPVTIEVMPGALQLLVNKK